MKHKLALVLSGTAAGVCNGLFGSGGGMIIVPCLEKYGELPTKKAHSTAVLVMAPLTLVSVLRYIRFAAIDIKIVGIACAGGVIGSILSSLFMKKLKTGLLKKLFGIVIIAAALRMVML